MKKIVFSLIIYVIFCSCSNDNIIDGLNKSKDNNDGKGFSILYTYTPNNPLNPYDSIGFWHNEALNEVISNKHLFTCDSADFINALKTILNEWFDDNRSYLPTYYTENYVDSLIDLTITRFSTFHPSSILENFALNDTAEAEIENLMYLIIGYEDSTSLTPLINSIKSWESSVISSSYSAELKEQLLKTSATARWSVAYWWDVANDENDPWWTVINCSSGSTTKQAGQISGFLDTFLKVLGVGVADGLGFLCCGLPGAITGSASAAVAVFTDGGILGAVEDFIEWVGSWFD